MANAQRDDEKYDWLFMVYLSGDNNLSSEMAWTINEIGEIYENSKTLRARIAITIQYDSLSPSSGTLRYVLSRDHERGKKSAELGPIPLQRYFEEELGPEDEDAGNRDVLKRFIDWSTDRHQSKYRMLILSGHGSGSVGDFLTDDDPGPPKRAPGTLTIKGLAYALNAARNVDQRPRPFDVLGMESCLMSTAEVCAQVYAPVKYLVASEGFVPNAGWPYRVMLTKLDDYYHSKSSTLPPEKLCVRLIDDYIDYYREYLPAGVSVDIAACDLTKFDDLNVSVSKLGELLRKKLTRHDQQNPPDEPSRTVGNMVVLAHWRAQSFKFEQFTDLWDFCDQLEFIVQKTVTPEGLDQAFKDIGTACSEVKAAVDIIVGRPIGGVGGRQDFAGIEFQHAHGLSVYFPWQMQSPKDRDFKTYGQLGFARDEKSGLGWAEFLEAYLNSTRTRGQEAV